MGAESRSSPSAAPAAEKPLRFYLRFGENAVPIGAESLLIGRGASCDIALDDPLVSRRHARVLLRDGRAIVEDLGSANGVFVNGERVSVTRWLATGDVLVIGTTKLEVIVGASTSPRTTPTLRPSVIDTADNTEVANIEKAKSDFDDASQPYTDMTRKGDALLLLGQVAEKMLVSGQTASAEQMLSARLKALLVETKASKHLVPETGEAAAGYAIKLAQAANKPQWVDYVFELYRAIRRPPPITIVDALYAVVRKIPPIRLTPLRDYVAELSSSNLSPAERFVLQRLNGLVKVAASR